MRKKYPITFLSLLFLQISFSVSFAVDPSQLIVVRAVDDSLWKATCVGKTCTSFTNIPGRLRSQPTLIWDDHIQRYVLWGQAPDNTIWRATFLRSGSFQNDWVRIPGSTPSPPGAAGGGISKNAWFDDPEVGDVEELTTTVTTLVDNFIVCPWDGYVLATSTGTINHDRASTSGFVWAKIFLSEVFEGTSDTYAYTNLPHNSETGITSFPYSISRSFRCPDGGGFKWIYVTGQEGGTASGTTKTTVNWPTLHLQYFPYVY